MVKLCYNFATIGFFVIFYRADDCVVLLFCYIFALSNYHT